MTLKRKSNTVAGARKYVKAMRALDLKIKITIYGEWRETSGSKDAITLEGAEVVLSKRGPAVVVLKYDRRLQIDEDPCFASRAFLLVEGTE